VGPNLQGALARRVLMLQTGEIARELAAAKCAERILTEFAENFRGPGSTRRKMTFKLPTEAQLREITDEIGLNYDDQVIRDMHAFLAPFVEGYNIIGRLPDDLPQSKYPRTPGYRPSPEENPHGAWYVKTEIKGSGKGKLKGRKVAVKDTMCLAGVPLANGTSILEGYVPEIDATVVTRLLDAGADIIGKAVCENFSYSGGSWTSATGPVDSPRNPGHTPGGSSTGSAALVVAGEVDMAMGGDQAGSIRIPASFSGIVGIKPTFGLVPYTGIMGLEYSIDHTGPMTAKVADNALYLEVLAGPDGYDSRQRDVKVKKYTTALEQGVEGLRIGVVREGFGQPDSEPDVDRTVRKAAERLGSLGASVNEISIPWHNYGLALWGAIALEGTVDVVNGNGFNHGPEGVYLPSLIKAMSHCRDRAGELPYTIATALVMGRYTEKQYRGHYYAKAQNLRRRLRAEYDAALAEHDLLLMPTTRMKTTKIPGPNAGYLEVMKHSWEMIANTCPFDVSHHPAISVPCGLSDGRPVGLMLVAKFWDEPTLYRAAHAFERAGDWQQWGP
jgi:amidase